MLQLRFQIKLIFDTSFILYFVRPVLI